MGEKITKHWKTSAAGIIAAVLTFLPLVDPKHTAIYRALTGLAAALGLIAAKDAGTEGP